MSAVQTPQLWNSADCPGLAAAPDQVIVAIDPSVLEDPDVPDVFVDLTRETNKVIAQLTELGASGFEEPEQSGDAAARPIRTPHSFGSSVVGGAA